jgi:hypothetical protein
MAIERNPHNIFDEHRSSFAPTALRIGNQSPKHMAAFQKMNAAEFHWHFLQGIKAIDHELYIPGTISLITGIEASIRWTLFQKSNERFTLTKDPGKTLSNKLLNIANLNGLPIGLLAFPEEKNFQENLKSNKTNVQLVALRHDLCHGNIQKFINTALGYENAFFTPECLRQTATDLTRICLNWIDGLSEYRSGMQCANLRIDSSG